MLFSRKEDVPDEIHKKREIFNQNIRRNNREEMFSKRRNLDEKNPQSSQNSSTQENKNYIVDPQYAQHIEQFLKGKYHIEALEQLIKALQTDDIISQHYGLIGIRKILSSQDDPPIQPIIDCGLIPKFVLYTKQEQFPQLQLEATWALANVASGSTNQCQSVVDKGGIPLFVKLLLSNCVGIVEQAIWALGNIAGDCALHRDTIIKLNGISNMVYAIQNATSTNTIQHGLWSLSNLCRGNPMPRYEQIEHGLSLIASKVSGGFIQGQDTLSDCLWAIAHNIKFSKERVQKILMDTGFLNKVSQFLNNQELSIVVPTIRILGNITMNRQNLPLILKDQRIMETISKLLDSYQKVVKTEICWVLSNIASGSQAEVNYLLEQQYLIGKLLDSFEKETVPVRAQIANIFSNLIIEGNPEIIFKFYSSINIIKLFLDNLCTNEVKLLKVCLQGLFSILSLGEEFRNDRGNPFVMDLLNLSGDKVLQQLQLHNDRSIYDQVVRIIYQFFVIDDSVNI